MFKFCFKIDLISLGLLVLSTLQTTPNLSSFNVDVYQHWYDYHNVNINNAIFKHVCEENHSVPLNDDKFGVVWWVDNTNKHKLIESILI